MIYKAIVVIWIFGAGGWVDRRMDVIEGILRGPCGPKNLRQKLGTSCAQSQILILLHFLTGEYIL